MAFVLPTFPIVCDIYDAATINAEIKRLVDVPCQLRAPNLSIPQYSNPSLSSNPMPSLILPPDTDIRDNYCVPINSADWVMVPAGSGRWYRVVYVDDVALGFPNEHRFACLLKQNGMPWPTPIPSGT